MDLYDLEMQRFWRNVLLEPRIVNELFSRNISTSSVNEKIRYAYNLAESEKMRPTSKDRVSKSAAKSAELRTIGNEAFYRKEYETALRFYTRSVALAPAGSRELAYAYANRSAALFKLRCERACLWDVNRAMSEDYPESVKRKLLDRKKQCVSIIRDRVDLVRSFSRCGIRNVIDPAVIVEFQKHFNPESTERADGDIFVLPKVNFKNKMIPNASEKIKMTVTPKKVAQIVAVDNIKPGEILAIEKSYTSILLRDYIYSHCSNCFVRCEALIPCPNCSMVMYCNSRCRDDAFNAYHRVECQICSSFSSSGMNLMQNGTAFRTLIVATKQGQELDSLMNNPDYEDPLAKSFEIDLKNKFDSCNYASVHNFGRRSSGNKYDDFSSTYESTIFLVVANWLFLLKQTTFFGEKQERDQTIKLKLNNRELYVAKFLLRCLQNDDLAIYETRELPNVTEDIEFSVDPVGYGLNPLMNGFGHSCDPHVKFYTYQNSLVCQAIRPIKQGEQIFCCYGKPYDSAPRFLRILSLQERFNFECVCKPCQFNWPTFAELSTKPKVLSNTINAKKFQEYHSKYEKLKNKGEINMTHDELLAFQCEYLFLLDRRFERPFQDYSLCQRALDVLLLTKGNFYKLEDVALKL